MKDICIVRQGHYPADPRVRKEATALIDKGYNVDIICLRYPGQKKEETINGIRLFRMPLQHKRGNLSRYIFEYISFFCCASIKLCALFFKKRYEVIQVNTLPDFLVFCTLIPKLLGAKVILDLHEPTPELWVTKFGDKKKFLVNIITYFEQMSIRYANHAITVSEQMKNNYVRRGASPSKITVILNVPTLEFNSALSKQTSQYSKNNTFNLTCHGLMVKRYGQETAIRGIALLKESIPNIQLTISGFGEHETDLKKLVDQLDLGDYVKFPGYLPLDEMLTMLLDSDIGIVPIEKNPYSDLVHTNKMFEFISLKKPVLISRTKAVEDFFGSDNSCLMYFNSGDEQAFAKGVLELYNSPETRAQMAVNAYAKFESVNWQITKDKYLNIFTQLRQ